MATAENALIKIEIGQTAYAMAAMTDSGDRTTFAGAASPWSKVPGFTPSVKPNGILTGGAVTPAAAAGNNNVDVAAITCYLNGVDTVVATDTDVTITRPATNVSKVNSITVNNAGVVAVVAGTDGASAAFSETRGAAGGPPFIPVDSIEVAQVRVTTSAAAVVTAAQIFALPGTHKELAAAPGFTINYFDGKVAFSTALPAIHTGSVAKKVYASFAAPLYGDIEKAVDFTLPETSYSVSSQQYYGGTEASQSKSLGAGGFTAFLGDGITDELVAAAGVPRWIKFFPDRYKAPYALGNATVGLARSFGADAPVASDCTLTATEAFREVAA